MKKNIELILSYLVIASAIQYAIMVSIALNFNFLPQHMASPGMVIGFITACSLNIVKLKEPIASRKIYAVSAFANMLTLSLATALSMQDQHIAKIITTLMMAIICVLSIFDWLNYTTTKTQPLKV